MSREAFNYLNLILPNYYFLKDVKYSLFYYYTLWAAAKALCNQINHFHTESFSGISEAISDLKSKIICYNVIV